MNQVKCMCQWMNNPVGIVDTPVFSWKVVGAAGIQKTFQINIYDDSQLTHSVWTCEMKDIRESTCKYDGQSLKSGTKYYYKVEVTDEENNRYISDVNEFVTGILEQVDWDLAWIGGAGMRNHSLRFRNELLIENEVKSATAFVASPNYYLLSLNGKRVSDCVLNNARTAYDKHMLYMTYPLKVKKGKNILGVEIGNGWNCLDLGERPVAKSEHLFALLLRIEYLSGKVEWKHSQKKDWIFTTDCPVVFDHIYHGETYDARKEKEKWNDLEFPQSELEKWLPVFEQDSPGGDIVSQQMEPIRIVEYIKPKEMFQLSDGSVTIDFGQNFAGWTRINIDEPENCTVTLKYAELLNEDHTINRISLKNAKATDTIICNGKKFFYEPRFTYHGFRYIQIQGITNFTLDDIIGCVVRNDVEYIGEFKCDNTLVENIYLNSIWSEKSNLHGLPTDCPQRDERLGWLNDMTVRNEGALYNFNLIQMYRKFMMDIKDTQGKTTGAISDTAPFYRMGQKPADPVSSSFLLIPWNVYCHYGDKSIIQENFEAMKKWTEYLKRHSTDYIVDYSPMGDWASPVKWTNADSIGAGSVSMITPTTYMATGYLYYNYRLLEKMAEVMCHPEEVKYCKTMAEKVKNAFIKTYYHKEGWFAQNSQASNAFALLLKIVDGQEKEKVLHNLIKDIEKNEYHLSTGNLCSRYVVEVLLEEGFTDVAWKILTQTSYPSWGYMIKNGATTMWERWERIVEPGPYSGMSSQNHPMTGAVAVCLPKYIAGIRVDEKKPGFKNTIFKPQIPENLTSASAKVESLYGTVSIAWNKTRGNMVEVDIEIPFNCSGVFESSPGYQIYDPRNNYEVTRKELTTGKHKIYMKKNRH